MLFPTVTFALFFLAVYAGNYLLVRYDRTRRVFLLLASYVFYASWNFRFLGLLVASTLVNYLLGLALRPKRKSEWKGWILGFGIVLNVGLLCTFKYYNFFAVSFMNLSELLGYHISLRLLEVALPLGISFYTFQGISYIVDVYKKRIPAEEAPLNVMLFVSFFPHLVSGPIVRAADLIPQLNKPIDPSRVELHRPLLLLLSGLFKKVFLATYLGTELVDPVFNSPESYSSLDVLFALYGYAFQIFCDFSAYTDMAIAFAALLGYEFPKNFDQPYRSHSLQEFWRRWHISLSSWLRDYLFIPLGGSKMGELKTYRNLFLTMLIGGIWHGASWTYVFWGALHGSGLALERWQREKHGEACHCHPSLVWNTVSVFHFVCFGWIFFRCDSFQKSIAFIEAFGNLENPTQKVTPFTVTLLVMGALIHFFPKDGLDRVSSWAQKLPAPVMGALCGIFLAGMYSVGPEEISPFIYFGF